MLQCLYYIVLACACVSCLCACAYIIYISLCALISLCVACSGSAAVRRVAGVRADPLRAEGQEDQRPARL